MARKFGRNARHFRKQETTYGVAPTGNWDSVPFSDVDAAADQGWIDDDVMNIAQTGDPQDPARDVQRVGGNLTVPLDLNNIGWDLKALFDDPTTSGASDYTHVFKSGKDSLPSFGMEVQYNASPYSGKQLLGMMANTLSLSGKFGTNRVKAQIGWLGAEEKKLTATGAGTPVTATLTRFLDSHAVVKQGGTTIGTVKDFNINFSNNLEPIEYQGGSLVAGYDPGMRTLGGDLNLRFENDTMLDLAIAGGAVDLEWFWQITATQSLLLQSTRTFLGRPRRPLSGPGGIDASFSIDKAAYDATPGAMLVATLLNQVASYPDPA